MNIFKFCLSFDARGKSTNVISNIQTEYAKVSQKQEKYKEYLVDCWEKTRMDNVRALYSKEAIIACGNINKNYYYIIDNDQNDSIDHSSVDILVISELENVNESFNYVFKNIEKHLKKNYKISLIPENSWLYIYDGTDIISTGITVKANVVSGGHIKKRELYRIIAYIIALFVAFSIGIAFNNIENSAISSVAFSVAASCVFFFLTEGLMHAGMGKTIEITEFSKDWVNKDDPVRKVIEKSDEPLTDPGV